MFARTDTKWATLHGIAALSVALALMLPSAAIAAPVSNAKFTYQGFLEENGLPADGIYEFVFDVYEDSGGTSSVTGPLPVPGIEVVDGHFTVELDFSGSVGNLFDGNERWLEIQVAPSPQDPFTVLPLQPIRPTPYAIYALNSSGGTSAFWEGVGTDIRNSNSGDVGINRSESVGIGARLGITGDVRLFQSPVSDQPSLELFTNENDDGGANLSMWMDGVETVKLDGSINGGVMGFLGLSAPEGRNVEIRADEGDGGSVMKLRELGSERIILDARSGSSPGFFMRSGSSGAYTVQVHSEPYGFIWLKDSNSNIDLVASGQANTDGGEIRLNSNGRPRITINANDGIGGSEMRLRAATEVETIVLRADENGEGASDILMYNGVFEAVQIETGSGFGNVNGALFLRNKDYRNVDIKADEGDGAAQLKLRSNGVDRVILDANWDGKSRVITDVLQITGGSDLSEQFDVSSNQTGIKPGMVVCIDPYDPGKLATSRQAYDRKVAGVVSGANGVAPGMLMGQDGTVADGEYPIALTGRVYVIADASAGAIEPGDLLTTSNVPGHAMKVADHGRAQGAILGKAMTPLESGQGMVLVLVSLQ